MVRWYRASPAAYPDGKLPLSLPSHSFQKVVVFVTASSNGLEVKSPIESQNLKSRNETVRWFCSRFRILLASMTIEGLGSAGLTPAAHPAEMFKCSRWGGVDTQPRYQRGRWRATRAISGTTWFYRCVLLIICRETRIRN